MKSEKAGEKTGTSVVKTQTTHDSETDMKTPPTDSVPEALLLGIRDLDGGLSTLFVDAHGFTLLGSQLAVPRTDGWWKLGRHRKFYADSKSFLTQSTQPPTRNGSRPHMNLTPVSWVSAKAAAFIMSLLWARIL